MKPALSLVASNTPSDLLRGLLPARDEAARNLAHVDRLIAEQLRALAKERGVAFIRVETARKELLG
jgi:hypothetical protein